ncbi:MAG: aminomethyl-transferring glycine dehydrogenase [Bacteroidota bacterium]
MSIPFSSRHIGPSEKELQSMLHKIGVLSLDELIEQTIPSNIRLSKPLNLPEQQSEYEYLKEIKNIASKNKLFRTYIGLGYYNCIVPPVIQRNILENPGWYTSYTPYQAEISQGRLEALLNFQTMVIDLTGMQIANASLLDEATAAAEAMIMFYNSRSREKIKNNANIFFVSDKCFPQTIDVLKTRAVPLGIEIAIGHTSNMYACGNKLFGSLIQYPDVNGAVNDYRDFINNAHTKNIFVAVAADLLSLTLLSPPGEWGADVTLGSTQRFGVPMGYGGPHAAFFASKENFKRVMPGRIIGVSVDSNGDPALRMSLQTREQHIRREKATSNICTAQALLAIMAGMYAVYHGPKGIKVIAENIHHNACLLEEELSKLGLKNENEFFFDTLAIHLPEKISVQQMKKISESKEINFRYAENKIFISLDETTTIKDVEDIVKVFAEAISNKSFNGINHSQKNIPYKVNLKLEASGMKRTSPFLTHSIFNSFHSETNMMRYIKRLENKDLSLTHSMISLGSCTMKLTAASELFPITWPEFANIHPFVPMEQAEGYRIVISELEKFLCEITGFSAVSFQPNSGAQGEYSGLLVIQSYHRNKGDVHRNIVLIPSSAHGTNPASAAMAGMKIVIVNCDEKGNIDVNDIKEKAEKHKENLSCLMITYPSTHGVFEEQIIEITHIIHENGGQVYMDGANMNAQVGLTNPSIIGADVCHLNLHKTFAIPHGGGGPGMGPICVAKHLAPFLPMHITQRSMNDLQNYELRTINDKPASAVSSSHFGSALILLISYSYIKMLGSKGLTDATKYAILNANYLKEMLIDHYNILYVGKNGRVAHEMILDCKEFKQKNGVLVEDIAKRLMDYGFHAPTVSFPVHDSLMIEPTESESMEELNKFCEALISIHTEIDEIISGKTDIANNVLLNAPHTAKSLIVGNWNHSYSREKAAYPLKWIKENKFWVPVGRVDNAYGDRNLICACPEIKNYVNALV